MMKPCLLAVSLLVLAACSDGTAPTATTPIGGATPVLALKAQGPAARVSAIRGNAGLGPVRRSGRLDRVALGHARDMQRNGFFSHTGSGGSTVGQRARAAGYRWCTVAENIGKGYPDMPAAIAGWENSRSHYRNLTLPKVKEVGVATSGAYYVMVLGARDC